jgi:hypothetical protein
MPHRLRFLRNFQEVNDSLYRGAQPSEEGFRELAKMGVRTGTVVALYRIEHDHWSNRQALGEAKSMKMASSETRMRKMILQYRPTSVVVRLNR